MVGKSAILGMAVLGSGCGHVDIYVFRENSSPKKIVAPTPSLTAEQFLKWSMSRYEAMKSFQAQMTLTMSSPGSSSETAGSVESRKISYAAPNRFKVASSEGDSPFLTSVSDGQQLVEYSYITHQPAMSYPAPDKINDANSMQMMHPMFCGTLLWQFFGGPSNYDKLVDTTKGSAVYGPEATSPGGELSRFVKFYGRQDYGHVKMLIGEQTGYVYQVYYDSEPTMKLVAAEAGRSLKVPIALNSVENYKSISVDAPIESKAFDTTPPKGTSIQSIGGDEKPPYPIGSQVPDFTVKTIGGSPVKLSSLRGHVVMIDFWATWCPPCRKGLPDTAHIAHLGTAKGLDVLAISDEAPKAISSFLKRQTYTVPAYVDAGGKVESQFKITGIPTIVVIDKDGKLVSFSVGLQDPSNVMASIKKAGLALN
jgi:thiol-disulfide isomerase/thioredoxin